MPDYVDITLLLLEAASSLGHGELIQSSRLSLFETTSAIEIGEPRMDLGLSTAEESNLPEFNASTAWMPVEIIYIMDKILSYEVCLNLEKKKEVLEMSSSRRMHYCKLDDLAPRILARTNHTHMPLHA